MIYISKYSWLKSTGRINASHCSILKYVTILTVFEFYGKQETSLSTTFWYYVLHIEVIFPMGSHIFFIEAPPKNKNHDTKFNDKDDDDKILEYRSFLPLFVKKIITPYIVTWVFKWRVDRVPKMILLLSKMVKDHRKSIFRPLQWIFHSVSKMRSAVMKIH